MALNKIPVNVKLNSLIQEKEKKERKGGRLSIHVIALKDQQYFSTHATRNWSSISLVEIYPLVSTITSKMKNQFISC